MVLAVKDSRNVRVRLKSRAFNFLILICLPLLMAATSHFGSVSIYPNVLLQGMLIGLTVSILILLFVRFNQKLFMFASFMVLLLLWLLTVSNWWHFQYFRSFYSYLNLASSGGMSDALRALHDFEYMGESFVLLFLMMALLISVAYCKPKKCDAGVVKYTIFMAVISVFGLLFPIHKDLKVAANRGVIQLTPQYFHPVFAFFVNPARPLQDYDEMKKDWYQFKGMNVAISNDNPRSNLEAGKKNVIILVMESFRASFIGHYGNPYGLTPNFDELAKKYVVHENFYTNSNYTVKSEVSILCGRYDFVGRPSIAEHSMAIEVDCLPKILNDQGYDSFYYHANYGRFYDRNEFMPKLGFDRSVFYADIDSQVDEDKIIGWGLNDVDMFKFFFSEIRNHKADHPDKPFFAHVMSLSAHYPFNYEWPLPDRLDLEPGDEVYMNYQKAIAYSDYALGEFWREFVDSELSQNTMVIITSDHGVWQFSNEDALSNAEKHELFFRAPLMVYDPETEHRSLDQVSSHIDLLPTILDALSIDYDGSDYLGKNIFKPVDNPWVVTGKNNSISLLMDSVLCEPAGYSCVGPQQSCYFVNHGVEDLDFCIDLDTHKVVSEPSYAQKQAVRMVMYENYKWFNDKSLAAKIPVHETRREMLREIEQ